MGPEFHLFLPQMRLSFEALGLRAVAAEAADFDGMALMDHLAPPLATDQPMFEAMVAATWLSARTSRIGVGHLVLCDAFRHPAVLARQAVSIDHASGGRFELGVGWGSVPEELGVFGVGDPAPGARVRRLAETLTVLKALWTGDVVNFEGEFHSITGGQQLPTPLGTIPIVIGGTGPKTLQLVAEHADWWNLPVGKLDRLDDMRVHAGEAKVSIQLMVAFVADESVRKEVTEKAQRRFGRMGDLLIGDATELTDRLATFSSRGVERFYIWFADFADPTTLAQFGQTVIEPLRRP